MCLLWMRVVIRVRGSVKQAMQAFLDVLALASAKYMRFEKRFPTMDGALLQQAFLAKLFPESIFFLRTKVAIRNADAAKCLVDTFELVADAVSDAVWLDNVKSEVALVCLFFWCVVS